MDWWEDGAVDDRYVDVNASGRKDRCGCGRRIDAVRVSTDEALIPDPVGAGSICFGAT